MLYHELLSYLVKASASKRY